MTLAALPQGADVFVDANIFIYAFAPNPTLGPSCEQLLERIENLDVRGFTSSHVLSDVAHRLMALEACAVFGWAHTGVAHRLKRHPAEVQKLSRYRRAVDEIAAIGIGVLPVTGKQVSLAADISGQTGLLSSDALVVAVMRDNHLSNLASNDPDFDGISGINRYSPTP